MTLQELTGKLQTMCHEGLSEMRVELSYKSGQSDICAIYEGIDGGEPVIFLQGKLRAGKEQSDD